MLVTSVNLGRSRRLAGPSFTGNTGICKEPVTAGVAVHASGLAGDAVLNVRHHGGPDQAVYVYRAEDYDWWSGQLGRTISPGTFGDNVTVSGLPGPDVAVGARLQFQEVLLEVTAPRIPCNTLAERMQDARFVKAFLQAERPGFYCRVLASGTLAAGEAYQLATATASDVTVLSMLRAASRTLTRAELEWLLAAPIDERSRQKFESALARLASEESSP
ncbi:MAG TPA: MOSC domain-containing protein [Pseudomonadales bacterium]